MQALRPTEKLSEKKKSKEEAKDAKSYIVVLFVCFVVDKLYISEVLEASFSVDVQAVVSVIGHLPVADMQLEEQFRFFRLSGMGFV